MGRLPCCDDNGLKKGPWTQEEDERLTCYIQKHGHGSWRSLPKNAGLNRCGKSCRLRWTNYLRPDIKRGRFSEEEEQMIIKLHSVLGNKWSRIAARLPGRTDNEIKNYWNTHLRKKLLQMGIDPVTHRPRTDLSLLSNISQLLSLPMTSTTPIMNSYPYDHINALNLQSNAAELAKLQVLNNIIQILHTSPNPSMDRSSAGLLGLSPSNTQLINNYNTPMNISGIFDVGVPSSSLSASVPSRSETEPCGVFDSWGGSGNCSQEMMEMKNYEHVRSGGHGAPAQDKLPGLVSASSTDQGASVNGNLTTNTNSTNGSMESLPDYEFLDGWDKLIDDGTSDFFWRDLLN